MTKTRDLADLGGGFIQAGTGAVQRTTESKLQDVVSVLDFIPAGTNTSAVNCSTFIQKAVDTGKPVYLPAGTYKISNTVNCSAGTWLIGDGAGETVLLADTNINPLVFSEPSVSEFTGAGISKLSVLGNGAAVTLVFVSNIWGFTAEHCRIAGSPAVQDCLRIEKYSFEAFINSCRITDADRYCVYLQEVGGQPPNGAFISNCDFSPNDQGTAICNEGVMSRIIGNWFEFATSLGGTSIKSTKQIVITGNNIGTGVGTNALYAIHLTSTVLHSLITSNKISVSGANATGILLDGSDNTTVTSNNFEVDAANSVIHCKGTSLANIKDNSFQLVQSGAYALSSCITLTDSAYGSNISGNSAYYGGTPTGIGINIDNGVTDTKLVDNILVGFSKGIDCNTNASNYRVTVTGNSVVGNTTPIEVTNPLDVYIKNNPGFKTENYGYPSSIPSGSTSVVVSHGLALTPSYRNIVLTPVDVTTNNVGPLYLTAINSTTFTVGCRADPGASGYLFAWSASISQ